MRSIEGNYTQSEQIILQILSDGYPHKRQELLSQMLDDNASMKIIREHVCRLRKKLPKGEDIVCRYVYRGLCYQHVRLMASAANGYR
jgi:DNA-binding response OmpR family regulator